MEFPRVTEKGTSVHVQELKIQVRIYSWAYGGFQLLLEVTNVICEDGKQRTAFITGRSDTIWTTPAKVNVGKKTVSGFITCDDGIYTFQTNSYGKNSDCIKGYFMKYLDQMEYNDLIKKGQDNES